MTWERLSVKQVASARRFSQDFQAKGLKRATISQCAKYLDDCFAFLHEEIDLKELCNRTGWDAL